MPPARKRAAVLIATLALAVASVLALDVSGRWTGQVPRRNGGEDRNVFEFHAEGKRLTGTVTTPTATYPIQSGTIEGDEIRFHIMVNMGSPVKFAYVGKVDGDEIGFSRVIDSMGIVVSFIAKRER